MGGYKSLCIPCQTLLIVSGIQGIQSIQMTNYALRMDWADVRRDLLSSWLSAVSSIFFVVHETADGENPHVHVFFSSDKKLNALRISFKRKFPDLVGNGAYSLKECDDNFEDYYLYMCKGDSQENLPVVLMKQGVDFSDDKIKEYHDRYWVNNNQIKISKRKRVAFAGTVVEQLEQICKEKGVRSKEDIAREYIRLYRDMRKPINCFQARAVVNTVTLLIKPDSNEEDILVGSII